MHCFHERTSYITRTTTTLATAMTETSRMSVSLPVVTFMTKLDIR